MLCHFIFQFVVESFIRNNKSVTTAQRKFRLYFKLNHRNAASNRKTIILWIENNYVTGSVLKQKPTGNQIVIGHQKMS